MNRSVMWFRRDLRIGDNPALLAAIEAGEEIVPIFILDPVFISHMGDKRLAYMSASLRSLDESLGGALQIHSGDPIEVLQEVMKRFDATSVHIGAEYEPTAVALEAKIEEAGIPLTRSGSPYAVAPGRVRKPSDGTPYKVYTPFHKAWLAHGWRSPAPKPKQIRAVTAPAEFRNFPSHNGPNEPASTNISPAGEVAALTRFKLFHKQALKDYADSRNFSAIDGTSKMSAHLAWGEIHPRTLLAELGDEEGDTVFRKEIAWREFYADVLFHNPHTDNGYYAPQFASMRYDKPGKKFTAWCEGKTGFPFVDAAMRQILQEGWMHNRTRMVVASFLVKDLHIEWQHGANFFREHLVDFDVASNSHGWQWTAGCGTDASPYYRVFNPIEQGKRFDPQGDYIRKYVPELAHLQVPDIHTPWEVLDGYLHGYPEPIVEHAKERLESLARLEEIKARKPD